MLLHRLSIAWDGQSQLINKTSFHSISCWFWIFFHNSNFRYFWHLYLQFRFLLMPYRCTYNLPFRLTFVFLSDSSFCLAFFRYLMPSHFYYRFTLPSFDALIPPTIFLSNISIMSFVHYAAPFLMLRFLLFLIAVIPFQFLRLRFLYLTYFL